VPLAVILTGLILIALAFRGTEHDTAKLLAADFGQGSQFWSWAAAIGVVGALGYAPRLRGVSTALLTLIILALVLKNGTGLFATLANVIKNPPAPRPAVSRSSYGNVLFGSSGSGGGGSAGGSAASIAEDAAIAAVLA
jgi:hypothetical protein